MSNLKGTVRRAGMTTIDGIIGGTAGPLPVTQALPLGTDARGVDVTSAMFPLVKAGTGKLPTRYLSIACMPTGVAAATVNAVYQLEQWDPDAALWIGTGPLPVLGTTPMDAAMDAGLTDKGNAHSVKVLRQCTLGRIYLRGLIAAQGVTFTIHPDNDD